MNKEAKGKEKLKRKKKCIKKESSRGYVTEKGTGVTRSLLYSLNIAYMESRLLTGIVTRLLLFFIQI